MRGTLCRGWLMRWPRVIGDLACDPASGQLAGLSLDEPFGAGLLSALGFAVAFGFAGFALSAGAAADFADASGFALACLTAAGFAGFASALLPLSAFDSSASDFFAATCDFFPRRGVA